MHPILETHYASLTKATDRKYFIEIVKHYPEIAPRYHQAIKKWINNNNKRADKTKQRMHEINDVIYDYMFSHMGFLQESHGFNIGDTFYLNRPSQPRVIVEFVVKPDGVYVLDTEYCKNPAIESPIMIERISHQPRPSGESHFAKQERHHLIDDITMMPVTSSVGGFLNYYAEDKYDFDPVYQRDLVWTDQQKEAFIKAIMIGDVEVRPTFIDIPYQYRNGGPAFVPFCTEVYQNGLCFVYNFETLVSNPFDYWLKPMNPRLSKMDTQFYT